MPNSPRPTIVMCALPTHCSAKETELYQRLRARHCADGRAAGRLLDGIEHNEFPT